jgi:pantoate--beta-alanine ligase
MGAFHEGHLQLMRRAKAENEHSVVSLFVNPTQFGKNEDFGKYPRDLDRDAQLAESAGVDILFAPEVAEVYPRVSSTIHVPEVTTSWEGASRPGHFDGVATIVAKLFNMVRPTVAYFGLKDLQQCMVIERMVEDLNMDLRLSLEPTVREDDGLAMSSRNVYLTPEEREAAPAIYRELNRLREVVLTKEDSQAAFAQSRDLLDSLGFAVDYLSLIDLPDMNETQLPSKRSAIICAAKLGTTRLIDNILI